MSLELVLGGSGSGKSYEMYMDVIDKSIANPKDNFIFIVPEQFTMETQRDVVKYHPRHGTMNIDVVSFNRLAYRIFEELNIKCNKVLEDLGKTMVIRRILDENKEELRVFKGCLNKQGFIDEVKSIFSEMFQYGISEQRIEEIISTMDKDSLLSLKLSDVLNIYKKFNEYMKDSYIVAEQLLDVLAEVIDDSQILRNSTIYIDGFTGFTPIQYKLLEKLISLGKKVIVSITIDSNELNKKKIKEHELFYLSKDTIRRLKEIAIKKSIQYSEKIMETNRRHSTGELVFLEKNLFRYPIEVFDLQADGINICALRDQRQELIYVGRQIRELVRDKGYRYIDIAIVTGDLPGLSNDVNSILPKLEIPFFMDSNREIDNNPGIELISSLIEMIVFDFDYDNVFRFLKTGMTGINLREIEKLENYVVATGIRGYSRWKKEFARKIRGLSEEDLVNINQTREKFIAQLVEVRKVISKKKGKVIDYATSLYKFTIDIDLAQQLHEEQIKLEFEGQNVEAKAYSKVYAMFVELLDKLVEILGESVMSNRDFMSIINTGLSDMSLGVIPGSIDQVTIGDIERTRLNNIKVLFFVNVNEGIIPKAAGDAGLITDIEREKLLESNVSLAPTNKQNAYIEQLYLYLNLTKPSEKLFITFSTINSEGKSLRPSYLVSRLTRMYPHLKVLERNNNQKNIENVNTFYESIDTFISQIINLEGGDKDILKGLFSIYSETEEGKRIIKLIEDGIIYSNEESKLDASVAKALYGRELNNSVTRLEKYAACAYSHFLKYGLQINERQEYKITPLDMGNVFHKVIEKFTKEVLDKKISWCDLSDEKRDSLVEESVLSVVGNDEESIYLSSARNTYLVNTITRIAKRTAWGIQKQIIRGSILPSEVEFEFGNYSGKLDTTKIELDNDVTMNLTGKIDRIDKYEDDENVYLSIIDYKSGNQVFDILDIYTGIQIQLVVYMNAIRELEGKRKPGKNIIPAGIFYFHVDDPIVDKCELDKIDESMLKSLRLRGLVNTSYDCINVLENMKDTLKIPLAYNKDGSIKKNSSIADNKQFLSLEKYVNDKVKYIGNEIINGNININPTKDGIKCQCDYCAYKAVCNFDKLTNKYSNVKKYNSQRVWEIINSGEKNKEDDENVDN